MITTIVAILPILQEINACKSCKYFSCKTCKILYYILRISCKSGGKNEAFLARYKKSCKIFARKDSKNFLARFDNNLATKLSCNFVLQDFCNVFTSCKKSFILSARLNARFCKFCRKNTCKTCIFLARPFLLSCIVECLTNCMGFKSHHITSLIICSLGADTRMHTRKHTHTYTHKHVYHIALQRINYLLRKQACWKAGACLV